MASIRSYGGGGELLSLGREGLRGNPLLLEDLEGMGLKKSRPSARA